MINQNNIKKILLTGGSGMLGKSILKHPNSNEWEIIAPTRQELDLYNYSETEKFVKKIKPDLIIHAASYSGGIEASMSGHADFLIRNIDIGRNIIISAKINNIKKLINLASSSMYPKNAKNPLSEDLILTGKLDQSNEGYTMSKIAITKLCEFIFKEKNDLKYKTIIPVNLYGPNDKFDPNQSTAIASIINKIYNAKKNRKKTVEIWGDGKARREFMYVDDFADCVVEGIKRFTDLPQLMNSGIGSDFTIKETYEIIAKTLNWDGKFTYNHNKPIGMKQKLVCTKKLIQFGWKHKISFEKGIKLTIDYYKNMINKHGRITR